MLSKKLNIDGFWCENTIVLALHCYWSTECLKVLLNLKCLQSYTGRVYNDRWCYHFTPATWRTWPWVVVRLDLPDTSTLQGPCIPDPYIVIEIPGIRKKHICIYLWVSSKFDWGSWRLCWNTINASSRLQHLHLRRNLYVPSDLVYLIQLRIQEIITYRLIYYFSCQDYTFLLDTTCWRPHCRPRLQFLHLRRDLCFQDIMNYIIVLQDIARYRFWWVIISLSMAWSHFQDKRTPHGKNSSSTRLWASHIYK